MKTKLLLGILILSLLIISGCEKADDIIGVTEKSITYREGLPSCRFEDTYLKIEVKDNYIFNERGLMDERERFASEKGYTVYAGTILFFCNNYGDSGILCLDEPKYVNVGCNACATITKDYEVIDDGLKCWSRYERQEWAKETINLNK